MKIQTSARLTSLQCDGKQIDLNEHHTIDLEFSAIDTGGGFKDPILDFSIPLERASEWRGKQPVLRLTLVDPNSDNKEVQFSFSGAVTISDQQINGRIKEGQLSRELIGFVLNLLR